MGVLGSAAAEFVDLEMWEEAVECYRQMNQVGRGGGLGGVGGGGKGVKRSARSIVAYQQRSTGTVTTPSPSEMLPDPQGGEDRPRAPPGEGNPRHAGGPGGAHARSGVLEARLGPLGGALRSRQGLC